jgi:hypothetical protein
LLTSVKEKAASIAVLIFCTAYGSLEFAGTTLALLKHSRSTTKKPALPPAFRFVSMRAA